ncbi:N-acetylmuramic acid 6-phosphate etherase [Aureimonas sp. SA4125]|uniref:N-acetylmuramic acid 6-phosphate etherase n=1 Tax=Aureimonas sp. SA4125 TaxID=2826993 RepID=UPI001CC3CFE3|nr:N-acetylmuramic acid 6-phosphate etherase [Aureimonas sp. SA4125]BDA86186.1 N-acetylmuramic acid 6-phosphate etherase [Aureimonas sp. SA4125]
MTLRATEQRHPAVADIEAWDDGRVLAELLKAQARAVAAVEAAVPALASAAALAVKSLDRGGRLIYLGAGSPALIALGDALEIPQTYGEPAERFLTILAGAPGITESLVGGPEDDGGQAEADVAAAGVGGADCVVALSASGSTPYTLAGLAAAKAAGAATVAIANNPGVPLLDIADVAIILDTGPEIIAGSTRMGAGTAQKVALNMLSTLVALRLGHIHGGHMINLRADNAKLRQRALRIVVDLSGADEHVAARALEAAGGEVKPAVLLASGERGIDAARSRLLRHSGRLDRAVGELAALTATVGP